MQKLLYVPLLCLALCTNATLSMFKRRANSDQTDMRTAIVARQTEKSKQEASKSDEVDISIKLRGVLKADPDAYFNRSHTNEEEVEEENSEENDDEDTTSSREFLGSAFKRKSVASLLPTVQPIAQPPKHLPLVNSTQEREQELFAAVSSKEEVVEKNEVQSLLKLGRKLALLQTAPLAQVQLINAHVGTDEVTPRMKQFFMSKLSAADDAVTIDDSDSTKPQVIIDLNKYFSSAIDLVSSEEHDIRQQSQSPPARYIPLSGDEEDDDDESSQEGQPMQSVYADRHTLGLKLEWLQKLSPDQIDIINFDPSLTTEELIVTKKELVALLASTTTAVNTNLHDDNFETEGLTIDISKLAGYANIIACRKIIEQNAGQKTREQSAPTKDPQPAIKQQPNMLQKIGIPAATGLLCFALGYLWALSRTH